MEYLSKLHEACLCSLGSACLMTLLCFSNESLSGQSLELDLISNIGGTYTSSEWNIDYSIGETLVETWQLESSDFHLTQGFHQPLMLENSLATSEADNISILLYPNPTSKYLNVNSEKDPISRLEIFDLLGRQVYHTINSEVIYTAFLDLGDLSAGFYVLVVNNDLVQKQQFIISNPK